MIKFLSIMVASRAQSLAPKFALSFTSEKISIVSWLITVSAQPPNDYRMCNFHHRVPVLLSTLSAITANKKMGLVATATS
jgi:hypothetical protein